MSSFDEWYDLATFEGEALFLFVDRKVAKFLCNAGMERAAEIVVEPVILSAGHEHDNLLLANRALAIRKEIGK